MDRSAQHLPRSTASIAPVDPQDYCKPRRKNHATGPFPTHHLYVAWRGKGRSSVTEVLQWLLDCGRDNDDAIGCDSIFAFGRLAGGVVMQNCHQMFLSFKSVEFAAEAFGIIENISVSVLKGTLVVNYAARKDDEVRENEHSSESSNSVTSAEARLMSLARVSPGVCVPGLKLIQNFVSATEETALLRELEQYPKHHLSHRSVQQFGTAFCYATRGISDEEKPPPFPPVVQGVADRMQPCFGESEITQMTVNHYSSTSSGIGAHVDTHSAFGPVIASLTLVAGASMIFRCMNHVDDQNNCVGRVKMVFLPRRSLLVMDGDARLCWSHAIPFKPFDVLSTIREESGSEALPYRIDREKCRVSLTFRTVRDNACACSFPHLCDSQNSPLQALSEAQRRHLSKSPQ